VRSITVNFSIIPRCSQDCDGLGQRRDLGCTWFVLDSGAFDPGPHARSQVRSIVGPCAQLHRQGLLA
jgi:hypothetical protein